MEEVLILIRDNNLYDGDLYIQIAKGKYEYPVTYSDKWKKFKRNVRIYIAQKINNRNGRY